MKKQIALPVLLGVLCLAFGCIPAAASVPPFPPIIFTTGGPEVPSPVGFGPLGPPTPDNPIPAVAWECPNLAGCNVGAIGFWDFNGIPDVGTVTPTVMNEVWLGPTAYSFSQFASSAPIQQTGCLHGVVLWCFEYMDLAALN